MTHTQQLNTTQIILHYNVSLVTYSGSTYTEGYKICYRSNSNGNPIKLFHASI